MGNIAVEKELVSIIMPAYNAEKNIKESITSIIKQTYKNWELIVIDDGSTDKTIQSIEEMASQEKRIRFYKNEENCGVSSTRNKGISIANGSWIAFLDSDDMWKKEKLEKQLKFADEKKVGFVFTGASYINENGIAYKGIFNVPEQVNYRKLKVHNVISCSSVLIQNRYLKELKMEKDDLHEDYLLWLKILKKYQIYANGLDEPLLTYRLSTNSKSGNKFKSIIMTYKVFRSVGINTIGSIYYTFRHLFNSLKKYRKILV